MDLLKDKKKLPLVIGLAVFLLLGAGGLIALELGAFNPPPAPVPVASSAPGPGLPPGVPSPPRPGPTPLPAGTPSQQVASRRIAIPRPGAVARPGGPVTPAVPVAPVLVNPAYGPDPFNIPGGTKRIAALTPLVVRAPLRSVLPVYNLFQIHPATPSSPPVLPVPAVGGQASALPITIQGIVKAADGIYAIASINGQSQTVKPGDSLLDGSRIESIQDSTVTIRSATGVTQTVSISSGGSPNDQGNGQGNDQGNGQTGDQGNTPPGGFGNGPQPFNQ